jgi:signal peptidase I
MEYDTNNTLNTTRNAPPTPEKKGTTPAPAKQPPRFSFLTEITTFALLAVLIVVPIRLFVAQPFIVNGASMSPTFETGDYLIIDQLSYHLENPARGDVVIFHYPIDPSKFFIKRVIGLPGEVVEIRGENVMIKNEAHPEGFILEEPYLSTERRDSGTTEVELGDDEYFVMGDNRPQSSDSRTWGPLGARYIVGRALVRLFPVYETSDIVFPGYYNVSTP